MKTIYCWWYELTGGIAMHVGMLFAGWSRGWEIGIRDGRAIWTGQDNDGKEAAGE